jgi:VCBS repeat-containing protein
LINYPDLATAFGGDARAATLHYIVAGYGEGRTDGPIPRPVDDAVTVAEDSGISRFAVLGNDGSTAPGGGALTLVDLDPNGSLGDVDILRSGRIAYDPAGAFETLAEGQAGTDSFRYTVRNADGQSATGRVTVTVTGANDAPVAAPDEAAANEDSAPSIAVLANDTDVDSGANLIVTALDTAGTTGAVTIAADGKSVTYDPTGRFDLAGGETATDTFTYTVSDGAGGESTATVTTTILGVDPPDGGVVAALGDTLL